MSSTAVTEGPSLPEVAEPAELRAELRHLAEQHPDRVPEQLRGPGGPGGLLWDRWHDELTRAGFDRESFQEVLAGHHRELWHWVWGDRTWQHCVEGLAGRLARRSPS